MPKYLKKFQDRERRMQYLAQEKRKRFSKFLVLQGKIWQNPSLVQRHTSRLQNLAPVRHGSICLLSGRAAGVYRHFRLSRHQIKQRFHFLTGLRIASW